MSDRTEQSRQQGPAVDTSKLAAELGADVYIALPGGRPSIDPASLARVAGLIAQRFQSSGGRPTDPRWVMTRQVPFAMDTWDRLGAVAEAISSHGQRVARGQLAAMLVETSLQGLADAFLTDPAALDAYIARIKLETAESVDVEHEDDEVVDCDTGSHR